MNTSIYIKLLAFVAAMSSVTAATDKPRRLRLAHDADTDTDTNRRGLQTSSMSMATEQSIDEIVSNMESIDAIVSKLEEEGEAVDAAALMLALAALEVDESPVHFGYGDFPTEKCLKLLFFLLPDDKASKLSFICGGPTCEDSISVGVDASSWTVGTGQSNGQFTLLEFEGVQVGIRAKERFVGPIQATDTDMDSIGEYAVKTGAGEGVVPTSAPAGSSWNFDWHVDVSNAVDTTKQTLAAYSELMFTVECVEGCATFGDGGPYSPNGVYTTPLSALGFGGGGDLFQASQSIGFSFWLWNDGIPVVIPGDGSYDLHEEGTYKCCLILEGFCPVCMLAKATSP